MESEGEAHGEKKRDDEKTRCQEIGETIDRGKESKLES